MAKEFILPIYKSLKPKDIGKAVEVVKRSRFYNPDLEVKPSEDKYRNAISKFIKGEQLFSKDYKILMYYLDSVEKRGYFNDFYKSFSEELGNIKSPRKFVKPMLSYIYNNYHKENNTNRIYEDLYKSKEKIKGKERFKHIYFLLNNLNVCNKYLENIERQFHRIDESKEIDELLKKYFISKTDEFYNKCMLVFIVNNHLNIEFRPQFESIFNTMNQDMRIELLKRILEIYVNEKDIDKYPNFWFDKVLNVLKDPYDSSNTRWNGISEECKESFRRWNNSRYLYEFFENTVVGGDRERLTFWKGYIDNIYRIRHLPDLNDALVMEFKNEVFIEFARKGNALYSYKKSVFSLDYINKKISLGQRISIFDLKDRDIVYKRLLHGRDWKYKFEHELKVLGYNKGTW